MLANSLPLPYMGNTHVNDSSSFCLHGLIWEWLICFMSRHHVCFVHMKKEERQIILYYIRRERTDIWHTKKIFNLIQTRSMQNERYQDNSDDDAQGFEDVLYQPSTTTNGDDNKLQKRPRRWSIFTRKLYYKIIKHDQCDLRISAWQLRWILYGIILSIDLIVTALSEKAWLNLLNFSV